MSFIPNALRQAHIDGNVVFLCGAGVSMPALPSFNALVKNVLSKFLPNEDWCRNDKICKTAWQVFNDRQYDDTLGFLESEFGRLLVCKAVADQLIDNKAKIDQHTILIQLSDLDHNKGRLVTTNFDLLFEKALKKFTKNENLNTQIHVAPSLPPANPTSSYGLTYLHGKLGTTENDYGLVLTTADFGKAYMLEGWARRFVVELSRHYHIVFLGYQVEDPVMRYLVVALAAVRAELGESQFKESYAFAPYGKDEQTKTREDVKSAWELKGVTPLIYHNPDRKHGHKKLWSELGKWARSYRLGREEKNQMVVKYIRSPPKTEEESQIADLIWALKDPKTARYFAERIDDERSEPKEERPEPKWLPYLQKSGLMSLPTVQTIADKPDSISVPLVSNTLNDGLKLHDSTYSLGIWVSHFLESLDTLHWAIKEGSVLHIDLRNIIQRRFNSINSGKVPALTKVWQVLSDDNYAMRLSQRNKSISSYLPKLGRGNIFANRVFLEKLRPIPIFTKKIQWEEQPEKDINRPSDWYAVNIQLVGIKYRHDIKKLKEKADRWEDVLAILVYDLTYLLVEAFDWLQEFGLVSPEDGLSAYECRSISSHEQNEYSENWTVLIELTRDAYDALSDQNEDEAALLVQHWLQIPYPVFQRLSLYAVTEGINSDVQLGLEILLNETNPALWNISTQREKMRFLRKRGADFSQENLFQLVDKIIEGPPRSEKFEALLEERREQWVDRSVWLLLASLSKSGANLPANAKERLDHFEVTYDWKLQEDHSDEFTMFNYSSVGIGLDEEGVSEDFLNMSVQDFINWSKSKEDNKDVFRVVWGEFLKRNMSKDEIKSVAETLQKMPLSILSQLDVYASYWLQDSRKKLGKRMRQGLWRRLWQASLQSETPNNDFTVNTAFNHSGGILADVLYFEMVEYIPRIDAGESPGLPKQLKKDFDLIAEGYSPSAKLARIKMAARLAYLHRIDPVWTRHTLLSRMDFSQEKLFESLLWQSYLMNPRCPNDLFMVFKDLFFMVLNDLDKAELSGTIRSNAIRLFMFIAIPPDGIVDMEEVKGVLLNLGKADLPSAASVLREVVEGAGKKASYLWKESMGDWFSEVWLPVDKKRRSVRLTEQLGKMAIYSGDAFPDVVDAIKNILCSKKGFFPTLSELVNNEKNLDLVRRFPDHSLILLDKTVSNQSEYIVNKNLNTALGIVANSKSELQQLDSYKRLNDMAQNAN
ncbi:MAG: SIR2 family protein [Magnetococcales bacterium]|nr:SIR2 family protein [Magnetococcales bacterium]